MSALEKHYSVNEVSEMWGFGRDKISELFRNEPDVMKSGRGERRGKRPYVTLAIPESAIRRVHRQLCSSEGD